VPISPSGIVHDAIVLGRRKRLLVRDVPDAWSVSKADYDGRPLLARFNTGYSDATDREDYPIQIGVAIPLKDVDEQGWPSGEENRVLQAVEDTMLSVLGGRAVLVGALTVNGVREFVLYSRDSDWIESFHRALDAAVPSHEVQVMAKQDPAWSTYLEFVHSA
jgi:hypothetical protein